MGPAVVKGIEVVTAANRWHQGRPSTQITIPSQSAAACWTVCYGRQRTSAQRVVLVDGEAKRHIRTIGIVGQVGIIR